MNDQLRYRHLAVAVLLVSSCRREQPNTAARSREPHSATAAAANVVRLEPQRGPRDARIIPLRFPSGDVDILYGDPDVAGQPFVIRILELPGTVIPPHSHPVDENITVLEGTWYFALGETYDSSKLRPLGRGAYAFAPAGSTMFGYSPDSAIVQVHGTGPFHISWRNGLVTDADSAAAGTFRFRKDEVVLAPRGRGRIRHAYASGSVIQYDIERVDGTRFMAHERDLRRP